MRPGCGGGVPHLLMETEAALAPQGRGFAGVRDAVGCILLVPGYRFALLGWCITPSSCSSQQEFFPCRDNTAAVPVEKHPLANSWASSCISPLLQISSCRC